MIKKCCHNCNDWFVTLPNVPHQKYCNKKKCQQARRSRWLKNATQTDIDYKEQKSISQNKWSSKNKCYWQKHRNNQSIEHTKLSNTKKDHTKAKQEKVTLIDTTKPREIELKIITQDPIVIHMSKSKRIIIG